VSLQTDRQTVSLLFSITDGTDSGSGNDSGSDSGSNDESSMII